MPRRSRLIALFVLVVVAAAWFITRDLCVSLWFTHGLSVPECPEGALRQVVDLSAPHVRRGEEARLEVAARALYTVGTADVVNETAVEEFTSEVVLVDRDQKEIKLDPKKPWRTSGSTHVAEIDFPKVPDGDYVLRAKVKSAIGESLAEAPLALYAPARVHVVTDRPLYEPGHVMKFRAVVLRARDLAPLDGRPGTWIVRDPSGETVLEERVPAGEWGITAGSFPIDRESPEGQWHVQYLSGGAWDDVTVDVHPFTLPRFRVETSAPKPFYRAGERPALEGRVVYSSGAPVAKAEVELAWSVDGEWPAPTEWLEKLLPKHATCDAAGKFALALPPVPGDLRGQATLRASVSAIDKAGDRVESSAAVLLSEDAITVSSVTELDGGLVGGFNNRVYLRASDAAGTLLPNISLLVKRAWDPTDKGVEVQADEDGVASLQLDPGPAVNVVIPPMPVRLPPREPVVSRGDAEELLTGEEASLADQRVFDGWLLALEPCARFVEGEGSVRAAVRVERTGVVSAVATGRTGLETCAAAVLKSRAFTGGKDRLYVLSLEFQEPQLASLSPSVSEVPEESSALSEAIGEFSRDARTCLPEDVAAGQLPRQLTYRLKEGSKDVATAWIAAAEGIAVSSSVLSCIEQKLSRLTLAEPAPMDALGAVTFTASPSPRVEEIRPQATTMLGYELKIVARANGRELGSTRIRLTEGTVPPLRLRLNPVLAKAGEPVKLELVRGPGFAGELPEELFLTSPRGDSVKAKVDPKARTASFPLPATAEGWWSVATNGATARVFVQRGSELSVEVASDRAKYAPGDAAKLSIRTTAGGKGREAAVGLFGVDETLGQLATLTGPDAYARLQAKVPMDRPAFPGLDAQALTLGRVRGANAAAAIVLGAGASEVPADLDVTTSTRGRSEFDPSIDLVDRFYSVLGELYGVVREWEQTAPKDEQLHPATVARLWIRARDAAAKKGAIVTDAWDRPLRLSKLPQDLLALVDPRLVAVDGTRLPEDVEDWSKYVAKERP